MEEPEGAQVSDGPRLIGRREAAAYCGISPTAFSGWVASHKMPPAIPGTRKWDKRAIDAKLDEISGLGGVSSSADTSDEFEKWDKSYRERQARRAPYKPRLQLRQQQQRVLMFMADHPDCQTVDTVPGAGQRTMEILIKAGAVHGTGGRYSLTRLGQEEAERLKVWLAR